MKRKLLSRMIALVLCTILTFGTAFDAFANYVTASLIGNSVSSAKWMSQISDDASIANLSLPGTHDSATKYIATPIAGAWTTTQNLTITEQLNAGVRYLDLRLAYDTSVDGNAKLVHSDIVCKDGNGNILTLKAVFNDLYKFLDTNPTEAIVVSVKRDSGDYPYELANAVETLINQNLAHWFTGYNAPTLGKVRGKCVLTTRMRECSYGIALNWGDQGSDGSYVDNSWYSVQDRYSMGADAKWSQATKPMLDTTKPLGKWYINFLSTTGGGIAGVSANSSTMNTYFSKYETQNNKSYGIIVFDYVSENLAKKVYKCNDLYAKNKPNDGQYYYRLNLNTTSPVSSGWSSVWMKLYYKTKNGTGSENSILLFTNEDSSNGYHFVCNAGNFDFSGVVDGFPTKVEFHFDWGYGAATLAQSQYLYVGSSPEDSLTRVITNDFVGSSSSSTPYKGTETYSAKAGLYPVASAVKFESTAGLSIQAPELGSSSLFKYTQNANVFDQYGVKWHKAPTSYSVDSVLEGINLDENIITVSQSANLNPNLSTFNLYAKYQDDKSVIQSPAKRVTLSTNKLQYAYKNYDGTVLQLGSGYAGTEPSYTGEAPTRPSDQSCHYIFRGWDKAEALGLGENVYTAQYTAVAHSIDKFENTAMPSCTDGGVDTYTCACGYSWQIESAPLGHSIKIDKKSATCTEDGYYKVYCSRCDFVEQDDVISALGHDAENAVLGNYVGATESVNGYQTYYCPRDNVEIVALRQYDANDWSGYYAAVKKAEDIQSSPDYGSYNSEDVLAFEQALSSAMEIHNGDEKAVIQANIDTATNQIILAIDTFAKATGSTYYTLSFIRYDGTIEMVTAKAGTPANQVEKPKNSSHVLTESTHTVFRWGDVTAVSGNATYYEYGTTSKHTYNTFVFPTVTTNPTCTQQGTRVQKCLCGYTVTEYTDALGHSYGEFVNNGDGTHTRICLLDENHIETEACALGEDFVCTDCGYLVDVTALEAIMVEAQYCLEHPEDYEQNSLDALKMAVNSVCISPTEIHNQAQADTFAKVIGEAMAGLVCKNIDIQLYVVADGEAIRLEGKKSFVGEKIELVVPADYGTVYKWNKGLDTKVSGFGNSLCVVVDGESVYYAVVDQGKEASDDYAKITLLNKSGRADSILYIKKGTYSVSAVDQGLTLGDNQYNIFASACPFYNVGGYALDGVAIGDSVTILDDGIITVSYVAK